MIKKFLKIFILTIIIISSFSCRNFMSGSDLIKELDNKIWISQHDPIGVKILSPINSPSGDYRNSSIIIAFTNAINIETFPDSFSVTNEKNESLIEHYSAPVWNEEHTQVTLTANEKKLIQIEQNTFLNITIKISKQLTNMENITLQNEISETFKINPV